MTQLFEFSVLSTINVLNELDLSTLFCIESILPQIETTIQIATITIIGLLGINFASRNAARLIGKGVITGVGVGIGKYATEKALKAIEEENKKKTNKTGSSTSGSSGNGAKTSGSSGNGAKTSGSNSTK
jgi:hypothetical protein